MKTFVIGFALAMIQFNQNAQNIFYPRLTTTSTQTQVVKFQSFLKNKRTQLGQYACLKLIGFNNKNNFPVDSFLNHYANNKLIKHLILEDCDLSNNINTEFNINQLTLLNEFNFIDSQLQLFLSNCNTEVLKIVSKDLTVDIDSLISKTAINRIIITDKNNPILKANKSDIIRYRDGKNLREIQVSYFGNYYKSAPTTRKKQNIKSIPTDKSSVAKITPLIPSIPIKDTVFYYNSKNNYFVYNSSSEIKIDPNAFVYQNNLPYTQDVKIVYKEFRNPVQILLSGIPMTNKDSSGFNLLQSAGMYELRAYTKLNEPLKTRSDTSIKVNYALTDTSSGYSTFALRDNGKWAMTSNSISTSANNNASIQSGITKAISEYISALAKYRMRTADTTRYEPRFNSKDYLYTYRVNNLLAAANKERYFKENRRFKAVVSHKANFKIVVAKKTKEGDIIFKIVKANKNYQNFALTAPLLNKPILYTGSLTLSEFKKTFTKKIRCWDIRSANNGSEIELEIKTNNYTAELNGMLVSLDSKKKKFELLRVSRNKAANNSIAKIRKSEARKFNRKARHESNNHNNLNTNLAYDRACEAAYNKTKKYMNDNEKAMSYKRWLDYVQSFLPTSTNYEIYNNSTVAKSLMKSGIGINNIDKYIHSCQMEDIYVNYPSNLSKELANSDNGYFIYPGINTTYPLTKLPSSISYKGYYFKNRENIAIRINDNLLEIVKHKQLKDNKDKESITITNSSTIDVNNLNETELSNLILEK